MLIYDFNNFIYNTFIKNFYFIIFPFANSKMMGTKKKFPGNCEFLNEITNFIEEIVYFLSEIVYFLEENTLNFLTDLYTVD